MLKIVTTISELNIEDFLGVYREDILENGARFFPELSGADLLRKSEDSFLSYLREDFFRQMDAFYALWVLESRYVAALRIEPYADGLLLEALSTASCDRRKGYGYALVSQTLQYLRSSAYKVVYSHINKKNIPSLELHKKCGFQQFSDSAKYIDGTVTQNSCTMCYYL